MTRRQVGNIRETSPGVWRVEVASGTHPVTGKRRRLSKVVHGTRKDAEVALSKLLLDAGKIPNSDLTVAQYLRDMYLPHLATRTRGSTVKSTTFYINKHIIPVLGHIKLAQLTPYQLDRWVSGITGAPRSRLRTYRVLSAALNLAVRWRLTDHNPLRAVEPPQTPRPQPDVLTPEEANAYLDAFRGHQIEAFVVLGLAAGLRRSELAGLRWSDIDLSKGTVTVERGLHEVGRELVTEPPKSQTSRRVVALPTWAVETLRPMRGIGPVVSENGHPMLPTRITRLFQRHVAACGLRPIPFKNLRHTHACLMLGAGVDLYTVSRRLGHSSVAVTETFYITPGKDADQAAADALDSVRHRAANAPMRHRAANLGTSMSDAERK